MCINFIYLSLNLFLSNFHLLIISFGSIVEILAAIILGCIIFKGRWVIGTFTNYIMKELLVVINRTHFDSYANKICNVYNILIYSIIFYYSLQVFTFFYTILHYSTIFYNILKISIISYNSLLFPTIFHLLLNILHYSTIFYNKYIFLQYSTIFYNFYVFYNFLKFSTIFYNFLLFYNFLPHLQNLLKNKK
jgi:hypothetical protein